MSTVSPAQRNGSYGVDAPAQILWMGGFAVVFFVAALIFGLLGSAGALGWFVFLGIVMLIQLALYVHSTRRGKFEVWEQVLDDLRLRGDESLLDMGCGRGAVLLAASPAAVRSASTSGARSTSPATPKRSPPAMPWRRASPPGWSSGPRI